MSSADRICPRCGWRNCACQLEATPSPRVTRHHTVSSCCAAEVRVVPEGVGTGRTRRHVCERCHAPCDAVEARNEPQRAETLAGEPKRV